MNHVLILGLGNPGEQYAASRHNAGWMFLDSLVRSWQGVVDVSWRMDKKTNSEIVRVTHGNTEYLLLKPQTYMNQSGDAAAAAVKWYLNLDPTLPDQEFPHVVVVHDDLDIAVGEYKLQFGSGPQVHNGLNSVRRHLHTKHFWVARLGIDGRGGDRSVSGEAYVLQSFLPQEKALLLDAFRFCAEELTYVV